MITVKYVYFFLVAFFIINHIASAQQNSLNENSLMAINKLPDDTNKIKKLFSLGYTLEETDTALCLKVYDEALRISRKIGNNYYECKTLINKGILNITHGYYDIARKYYLQAHEVAVKSKNNENISKCLINIGNTYINQNNYNKGLTYYLDGVKFFEKEKDFSTLARVYSNIGLAFGQQRLFKNELIYCNKALETALLLNDSNAIGNCYANLDIAYNHQNDSLKSFEVSEKAISYLRNSPYKAQLAIAYQNLSHHYTRSNEYSKALAFSDSCLAISLSIGASNSIALALISQSILALRKNDFITSKEKIVEAKKYVVDDGSWILWREWNLQMSNLSEAKGDYKEAFQYYVECQLFVDSIKNEDLQKNSETLEARYQSEKKESQIKQLEKEKELQTLSLKQKNTFNALLIVGMIAAVIIGILFYRNTKRQRLLARKTNEIKDIRIKELEREKQLVSINSILQIQEAERSRMAKDLHDGLGGMLSAIKLNLSSVKGNISIGEKDSLLFNKSIVQLDNTIAEMRRVAHNMMPEALLKFGLVEAVQDYCESINESKVVQMKFTNIGFSEKLTQSTEVTLYRIIQELVNNSLKHADAKNIFIQLNKHAKGISLSVEDDGKGFNAAEAINKKGAGLQNVQTRVDYLKGTLSIDAAAGNGSSINIEIPVIE